MFARCRTGSRTRKRSSRTHSGYGDASSARITCSTSTFSASSPVHPSIIFGVRLVRGRLFDLRSVSCPCGARTGGGRGAGTRSRDRKEGARCQLDPRHRDPARHGGPPLGPGTTEITKSHHAAISRKYSQLRACCSHCPQQQAKAAKEACEAILAVRERLLDGDSGGSNPLIAQVHLKLVVYFFLVCLLLHWSALAFVFQHHIPEYHLR